MCCTTLNLREATIATTEFTRPACFEVCWPRSAGQETEQKVLRMNWVVATDKSGKLQLLMHWASRRE